jgi:hypothetical protein
MDNKRKPKSLTVSDEINILAQLDTHIGTHVEQASKLRFSVPTLNPFVKNREEIQRSFIQSAPLSKQWKSLKCLPLEELESALAA